MDPPPSHGRIKYPDGNISPLTNCEDAAAFGPEPLPESDLSHTFIDQKEQKLVLI